MYFKPDNLFARIAPVTLQYELKKRPYDFSIGITTIALRSERTGRES